MGRQRSASLLLHSAQGIFRSVSVSHVTWSVCRDILTHRVQRLVKIRLLWTLFIVSHRYKLSLCSVWVKYDGLWCIETQRWELKRKQAYMGVCRTNAEECLSPLYTLLADAHTLPARSRQNGHPCPSTYGLFFSFLDL